VVAVAAFVVVFVVVAFVAKAERRAVAVESDQEPLEAQAAEASAYAQLVGVRVADPAASHAQSAFGAVSVCFPLCRPG